MLTSVLSWDIFGLLSFLQPPLIYQILNSRGAKGVVSMCLKGILLASLFC
jgi:hypothetical protein